MQKKWIVVCIVVLIILSQLTYFIDKNRINDMKEPLFAFKTDVIKDGGIYLIP